MAAWVRLALDSISVEYPSNEVLQSFSAFELRDVNVDYAEIQFRTKCNRLSQVFGVDFEKLQAQLQSVRPYALKHFRDQGSESDSGSCFDAWKYAVAYTQKHVRASARPDLDTLIPTLKAFGRWHGATSSGVEQTFSIATQLQRPQRSNHNSNIMIRNELKVATMAKEDVPEIIKQARRIWAQEFGPPRKRFRRAKVDVLSANL